MHPAEWHWQLDARLAKAKHRPGQLSEAEALEMKDELKRARVKAGYPPE